MTVFIRTDALSPRLEYALHVIFTIHLNSAYKLTFSWDECKPGSVIINYAAMPDPRAHLNIYNQGLLFKTDLKEPSPRAYVKESLPYFFPCPAGRKAGFSLEFDLFSVIFYLISRYEEYGAYIPDKYGRFSASESLAARYGFLEEPIVDQWILRFGDMISRVSGHTFPGHRRYMNQPTVDIDIPFAYKGKGWLNYAGLIKDLIQIKGQRYRMRMNFMNGGQDPFDTYGYMSEVFEKNGIDPVFFFLMRYQKPWDENHALSHPAFKNCCWELGKKYQIGIHPSIYANQDRQFIRDEKELLESISGKSISMSRQHFLLLQLPLTYQRLINLGIHTDFSMMYADAVGFRASTSLPFPWYDLSEEKQTKLTVVPSCIMDASMRWYMKASPQEAIDMVEQIKNKVKSVEGQLTWIWHNSSFSAAYGWEGWEEVFECLCSD